MCFQRTDVLTAAHTEHLFHLRTKCIGHKEFKRGYQVLISHELNKYLEDLQIDEFKWIKQKIERI